MKALFKLRGMKLLNSVEMVAAGLMGITLFFLFLCYPHGNNILKNRWFWEKIFVVLSWMIGLQITVLTFVLSIYLPAIIKDINNYRD